MTRLMIEVISKDLSFNGQTLQVVALLQQIVFKYSTWALPPNAKKKIFQFDRILIKIQIPSNEVI